MFCQLLNNSLCSNRINRRSATMQKDAPRITDLAKRKIINSNLDEFNLSLRHILEPLPDSEDENHESLEPEAEVADDLLIAVSDWARLSLLLPESKHRKLTAKLLAFKDILIGELGTGMLDQLVNSRGYIDVTVAFNKKSRLLPMSEEAAAAQRKYFGKTFVLVFQDYAQITYGLKDILGEPLPEPAERWTRAFHELEEYFRVFFGCFADVKDVLDDLCNKEYREEFWWLKEDPRAAKKNLSRMRISASRRISA